MDEFRAWAAEHPGLDLRVVIDTRTRARGIGCETHDSVPVTYALKPPALGKALEAGGWRAPITRVRRGEDPARAKECCLSPRDGAGTRHYTDQPPEFWHPFETPP